MDERVARPGAWWGPRSVLVVGACLVLLALGAPPAEAVVGGRTAARDDVPVVALWAGDGGAPAPGRPTCSGVLVAADLVLTAAHCVSDGKAVTVQPYELRLAIGARDARWTGRDPAARGVRVASVARHPDARLDAGRDEVDLAVLRLRRPLAGVRPLPPATGRAARAAARTGALLRVTGYGATSSDGDTVLRRRAVSARVPPWSRVPRYSPASGLSRARITPLQGTRGRRGVACFGDSGAPVLDRRDRLVGLVSGGLASGDCRVVGTAAVRLAAQRAWMLGGGQAAPAPRVAPAVPDGASIGRRATCRLRIPEGVRWEGWWERQLTPEESTQGLGGDDGVAEAQDGPVGVGGGGEHAEQDRLEEISTRVTDEDDGWRLRCVVLLVDADGRRSVSRSAPIDVRAEPGRR